MPPLKSLAGLQMTVKYVSNWYSLLSLYVGIKSKTTIKFRDGKKIIISKSNKPVISQAGIMMPWLHSSKNFDEFLEEIYKRYLQDRGFIYKTLEQKTITETKDGLQFVLLKPAYSYVLDEVFIIKVYGEPDLKGRTVIDVGASIADTAIYFAKLGASMIYGFEDDLERYRLAKENIALNDMNDRIIIYNEVASKDSLEKLILEHKMRNIFLKLDCEGCEYQIIREIDDSIFENIPDIIMEYHRSPDPLMQRLTELGYKVHRRNEIISGSRD